MKIEEGVLCIVVSDNNVHTFKRGQLVMVREELPLGRGDKRLWKCCEVTEDLVVRPSNSQVLQERELFRYDAIPRRKNKALMWAIALSLAFVIVMQACKFYVPAMIGTWVTSVLFLVELDRKI